MPIQRVKPPWDALQEPISAGTVNTIDVSHVVPAASFELTEGVFDDTPLTAADLRDAGVPIPNVVPDEAVLVGESYRLAADRPKCPDDEHDPDDDQVCRRCICRVCLGCGHAFDLMCNLCDEGEPETP